MADDTEMGQILGWWAFFGNQPIFICELQEELFFLALAFSMEVSISSLWFWGVFCAAQSLMDGRQESEWGTGTE